MREREVIVVELSVAEYASSIIDVLTKVCRAKVTGQKGGDADAKPQSPFTPEEDAAELDALLPPDTVWLGG